jgi:HEAT repeat protein
MFRLDRFLLRYINKHSVLDCPMNLSVEEIRDQMAHGDPGKRMAALVALRFIDEEAAAPILVAAATDPIPLVRVYAAIGLGKKHGAGTFELLTTLLNEDKDASVRAEAAGSLGSYPDQNAAEYLVRSYYEDMDWIVRYSVIVSLGQLQDPRGYSVLRSALTSETEMIRDAAISALGELGNAQAIEVLLPLISSSDSEVRRRVAQALGAIGTPACRSPLNYLIKDENPTVAEFAQHALAKLDEKS